MSSAHARAFWITGPQKADIRTEVAGSSGDGLEVCTLFSGVSRGTERLVFRGQVPASEHETMRAPFQEGAFSFPVKYGYAAVGRVQNGVRAGKIVFALVPHQTHFCVPESMACPVPQDVPAGRAILAANMETALTILWDSGIGPGDKVAVVGCGVVGALAGYLAARVPGTEVTLVDVDPSRAPLADALGCAFATPDEAGDMVSGDADLVIHASASQAGFATAISLAGMEATLVEASWYGDKAIQAPLGGRFHQRRLRIIGSQVGRIPAARAARWDFPRRLGKAMSLLADPCLDALISGQTAFDDLPAKYGAILDDPATLCHRISYEN